MSMATARRIGFVSTRLAGTDGVSLEVNKWMQVLSGLGHACYYFAGEIDWPAERSLLVAEAHFNHPGILTISRDLFDDRMRSRETSRQVQYYKELLKEQLYAFIERFQLDLIIPQNALAIPMNVPLGLALAELIAETQLPTIAHHHDFAWERIRFIVNGAGDYLNAAFPPNLPSIRHVVINSVAGQQLAMRRGVGSTLIPNVMQFEVEPPPPDGYADELRALLGIAPHELFVLQPTRVVPRKRIERAIELVKQLERPATLVISHEAGDEGHDYADYLASYAQLLGVRVLFGSERFAYSRGLNERGEKLFSLADVYQQCDLVTYPSGLEGFGNAFLEAIYYRRPIVISAYEIYRADIQPKGFDVVDFDEFITADTVAATQELISSPERIARAVEHNYALAKGYYGYSSLEKHLAALLNDLLGT